MPWNEFVTWVKYRGKRGSLNTGMRVETAVARFASFYGNCRSGKKTFSIEDFAPHLDAPQLSLEEAMATWA